MTALSPRELEVARLLAQGLRHKEVAARMGIAPATVAFYTRRIVAKTGAETTIAAVVLVALDELATA